MHVHSRWCAKLTPSYPQQMYTLNSQYQTPLRPLEISTDTNPKTLWSQSRESTKTHKYHPHMNSFTIPIPYQPLYNTTWTRTGRAGGGRQTPVSPISNPELMMYTDGQHPGNQPVGYQSICCPIHQREDPKIGGCTTSHNVTGTKREPPWTLPNLPRGRRQVVRPETANIDTHCPQ